jgi:hydrogenase/urease accessory protein HupE
VQSHTGGIAGFATVTVTGDTLHYTLTLPSIPPGSLADRMRLGRADAAPDYAPLIEALSQKIVISADGRPCAPTQGRIEPPSAQSSGIRASVDFACSKRIDSLSIRDDMPDVLGSDHHTLALLTGPQGSRQFTFGADARFAQFLLGATTPASAGAGSFFPLGIEHILTGYDHLLFLLALVLRGNSLRQLLGIITAFTLAHSLTLGLSALRMVVLPAAFVEATIALSIAYVAAENLFPRYAVARRWTLAFLFGLVHGFGFSSALREAGLPQENLLACLLCFNLGVEAGQAAVVAMAVPILLRMRRMTWEPRAVTIVSGLILAFGLGLFLERAVSAA